MAKIPGTVSGKFETARFLSQVDAARPVEGTTPADALKAELGAALKAEMTAQISELWSHMDNVKEEFLKREIDAQLSELQRQVTRLSGELAAANAKAEMEAQVSELRCYIARLLEELTAARKASEPGAEGMGVR
eukprot:TRINITY_DN19268_c0_g1_i2.p1 TRINITY_DN19268_c0_g1~~TRINITY_DN19268_c0_g1_i2.p1  ORF type:complete len:134 (-),score=30.26 TRINITY_DN19268_c0_g1_i2:237-638(-)